MAGFAILMSLADRLSKPVALLIPTLSIYFDVSLSVICLNSKVSMFGWLLLIAWTLEWVERSSLQPPPILAATFTKYLLKVFATSFWFVNILSSS